MSAGASQRVHVVRDAAWRRDGSHPLAPHLSDARAVLVRGTLGEETCAAWIRNVRRAKKDWARDFGGEQFTLGRAFYTHYETERSDLYFRDAAASDRRVEQHLPGMQTWVTDLFARMVGATARKRMGFCGPGVHVFPAREKVAKHGGIVHYDVEGLTPIALARRHAALSLVVMLQVPEHGGGLRLYDVEYSGTESVSDEELKAPRATVRYRNGDALLMSSYRLHQIRPFRGTRDRVSITLHAEEVDRGVWETWF